MFIYYMVEAQAKERVDALSVLVNTSKSPESQYSGAKISRMCPVATGPPSGVRLGLPLALTSLVVI